MSGVQMAINVGRQKLKNLNSNFHTFFQGKVEGLENQTKKTVGGFSYPSWELTWLAGKSPFFNRKYLFKLLFFSLSC